MFQLLRKWQHLCATSGKLGLDPTEPDWSQSLQSPLAHLILGHNARELFYLLRITHLLCLPTAKFWRNTLLPPEKRLFISSAIPVLREKLPFQNPSLFLLFVNAAAVPWGKDPHPTLFPAPSPEKCL